MLSLSFSKMMILPLESRTLNKDLANSPNQTFDSSATLELTRFSENASNHHPSQNGQGLPTAGGERVEPSPEWRYHPQFPLFFEYSESLDKKTDSGRLLNECLFYGGYPITGGSIPICQNSAINSPR